MSTITIADKFSRCDDFASRVEGLYLPDEAWAVFAELDEPATGEQIAARTQLPIETVLDALNQLTDQKLVRKQLSSWRDFLAKKSVSTPSAPTKPVADALAAGRPGAALAGWPKPDGPAPEVAVTPAIPDAPSAKSAETGAAIETAPVVEDAPAPAAPAAAIEPPPVLFTDFQLPAKPLHHAPAPADTPVAPASLPADPVVDAIAPDATPAEARPARATAVPAAPAPAPVPVAAVSAPTATVAAPRHAPETILPVAFTLANDKASFERKAAAAMTISFRITAAAKETPSAWRLRPLLQAIEQKGGGGLPGQLLVYRVFIHVPADLMHAAGIQSISLVDDNVVIRDRAFYDSLCQAARAVASIDLRAVTA